MKPNIFDIGTKELNQDTFITWLLLFADDSNAKEFTEDDKLINKCSKDFITQLVRLYYPTERIEFKKIEAGRQWEQIDVWATIDDRFLIVIEDKTSTGQHSGQLAKYKKVSEDWCQAQKPQYLSPICIYLKTGNEAIGSLKKVETEGFKIFNRASFLKILASYSGIQNHIFQDFSQRLHRLEEAVKKYEFKKIEEWNGDDWVGFYQFVDSSIDVVNWYYLNNLAGGFWNLILEWPQWNGFPVHYQIEEGRIAFKISFDKEEIDYEDESQYNKDFEQDRWQSILLKNSRNNFPEIKRPNYYRHTGVWRTVAVIERDSWLTSANGMLDKKSVLSYLERLRTFVKECTSLKD